MVVVAVPYVPAPVSFTERPPPPPPFTSRYEIFALFVVGLKVASSVQVLYAVNDLPQLPVKENCPGFVPLSAMPVMATALALVFVTVTDCAALTVWMGRLPKASDHGESVSVEVVSAWPATATE